MFTTTEELTVLSNALAFPDELDVSWGHDVQEKKLVRAMRSKVNGELKRRYEQQMKLSTKPQPPASPP